MSDQWCGWLDRPAEVEAYLTTLPKPMFAQAADNLAGSGAGKIVLLYEAARKVMSRDLDAGPQLIGDCVSWGYGGSHDLLACVEVMQGEAEEYSYDNRAATEVIYALSRVEYGNFDGSYKDGSVGAWAAKAATLGGTLGRLKLGKYDPKRAKEWGAKGLPNELEPEAKQHRVKSAALVTTFTEARDSIANGYPVPVCSSVGFQTAGPFTTKRDAKGFSRPKGRWDHCMKFIATRDDDRPGLLCYSSWDFESVIGPKGDFDIPDASFWVDADVVDTMLRGRDSFALSGFEGYPAQTLTWLIAP